MLPAVKLGVLALKTVSKPLANAVKRRATSHPKFREFIIGLAQRYHKINVQLQRRLYGHATNVDIKPLNEAAAVATAADLVGEVVIFGIAGGLVVLEVSRGAVSEARKEEARRQNLEALRAKDEELREELQRVTKRVEELEASLGGSWLPLGAKRQRVTGSSAPPPPLTAQEADGNITQPSV